MFKAAFIKTRLEDSEQRMFLEARTRIFGALHVTVKNASSPWLTGVTFQQFFSLPYYCIPRN